jgi:hypothetical protein
MKQRILVLLPMLAITALCHPAWSADEAATEIAMGNYFAVTTSARASTELNLSDDGTATYTISSRGSGNTLSSTSRDALRGRWELKGDIVTVGFSGDHAGQTLTYRVETCLSYQPFGRNDCSPGLELVESTVPRSFSDRLWSALTFKIQGQR